MKKRKLNVLAKSIILVIMIPLLILLLSMSFDSNSKETLHYEEKSDLDYKVCLKEKGSYDELCQKKGMGYVASAIDYVSIDFKYDFIMNKPVDYNYEYYIDGLITINEKGKSNIDLLTKKVDLSELVRLQVDNNDRFSISKNIEIKYDEYNDLIKTYKETYSVPVDSTLKITLHIKADSKYEYFSNPIQTNTVMEMVIPLTDSTIDIKMNYKEANNSDKITQDSNELNINFVYFILSLVLISGIIYLISSIIMMRMKIYSRQSDYSKFMKKLQKNYNRMIVNIANNMKIEEEDYDEIFDVTDFEELVDISQSVAKNIIWTEVVHDDGLVVSWYTISENKRLYRKIYKSTDTKEELK